MTTPARERHWVTFGASVQGSAHVRDSIPNQDAVAFEHAGDGEWAAIAVADGHGHALAVRAGWGARLAVETALGAARECWEALAGDARRFVGEQVAAKLPSAISTTWLAQVEHNLSVSPLTDAEIARSGNAESITAHPELAYGTTLLVCLAVAGSMVACQVGDGDILAVRSDGEVLRLLPPDVRLIGSTTTSLASRSAGDDFRSGHFDAHLEQIEVVLAASDGYVNSFRSDEGFVTAGRDLQQLLHDAGPGAVEGSLASWLESTSTEGTGDDASMALLYDAAALEPGTDAGTTVTATP